MSSLKQNFSRIKEEAQEKEFEKAKSTLKKTDMMKFCLLSLLTSIFIYSIAITILYKKQKITWSDADSLVLDKWAYVSLTILTIFFFYVTLLGVVDSKYELFFEVIKEKKEEMK